MIIKSDIILPVLVVENAFVSVQGPLQKLSIKLFKQSRKVNCSKYHRICYNYVEQA